MDETGTNEADVVNIRARKLDKTAVQYTGNNLSGLQEWSGGHVLVDGEGKIWVVTLEGKRPLPIDWWVIHGVMDEYYPIHPKVFEQTYIIVEESWEASATQK